MNPFIRFSGAILMLLSLIQAPSLHAQEQLGMRFERFAGLNGATLNPAQSAFMPHPWEVNLVGADVFFENNYCYVTNTGVFRLLRHSDEIIQLTDTSDASQPFSSGDMRLGYFSNRQWMRGVVQTRISGPGFAMRIGENHVVGISTALRGQSSSYNVPECLRADKLEARKRFDPLLVTPLNAGVLTWGEVGLHYSYRQAGDAITLAVGVSPKLLLGYEAGFVRSSDNLEFCWTQLDSMSFSSGNWDIAMTTGNLDPAGQMSANGNIASGEISPQLNGYGAGLDFGIVLAAPGYDGETDEDYCWRVGVSVIDFGLIRFNRHAERHNFSFDTTHVISGLEFSDQRDPQEVIDMANMYFLGKYGESLKAEKFTAALPSAVVVQLDYRIVPNFFAGAVWVQRTPLSKFAIKRVNTLSILPRYETRWLSVSAPVTFSDWQSVRFGLAARLGWLTIGTDNLNSFFRQNQFTGSDFYIGIKINGWKQPFYNGTSMSNRSSRHIPCFRF